MRSRLSRFLFLSFCFTLLTIVGYGQQRPLVTEDVDIVKPGNIRVQVGIDFNQKQRFGLSGLSGDVTQIGDIGIYFGMSPNVQFEITGTVRNYLNIESRGPSAIPLNIGNSTNTHDVGDFT